MRKDKSEDDKIRGKKKDEGSRSMNHYKRKVLKKETNTEMDQGKKL